MADNPRSRGPYNGAELAALAAAEKRGEAVGRAAVTRAVHKVLDGMIETALSSLICGVVLPHATPDGSAVACAHHPGHLNEHSWASLPTCVQEA